MSIDHRVAQFESIAAVWTARARECGKRPDARSVLLRARAQNLTTLLNELRKRIAAAQALSHRIDALLIETGADDAMADRAQQKEAA